MRVNRKVIGLLVAVTTMLSGCGVAVTTAPTPLPTQPSQVASTQLPEDEPLAEEESQVEQEPAATESAAELHASVGTMFLPPVRILAGGEPVSVEAPGYACPTMADVDGDGKADLVVGQFRNGNMQVCKNVARQGEPQKFAKAEWLKTGDQRATVPGVW